MSDLFGNETVRTLGLYQPFAALMLYDKIETRWVLKGRKPPFPLGKYLIYACKKRYSDSELLELVYSSRCESIDILASDDKAFDQRGSAICVGDLVKIIDPFTITDYDKSYLKPQFLRDTQRMVGLVFKNVRRIKPFPVTGKQGIGFLSDSEKSKIKFI